MLRFIAIGLIVCYLLRVSWDIRVELNFNSVDGEGTLIIYFFNCKVIKIKAFLDLYNKAIKLIMNDKVKLITLNNNANDENSILNTIKNSDTNLLTHIDIKSVSLFAIIGTNNAFYTAVFAQALRIAYSTIVSYIRQKQLLQAREYIIADYFNKKIQLNLSCLISISICELLGAIVETTGRKFKKRLKEII